MKIGHGLLGAAAVIGSTVLLQGTALAEGASFTLNLPVLSYASASTKPDGGDESKTTSMETADLGQAYTAISWGKFVVYLWHPFNDAKVVSAGYMVSNELEVGIDLGLNSTKVDEPESESSTNTMGVYGFFYPKVGSNSAEVGLMIDSISEKGESTSVDATTGAATTVETDESTMLIKLVANFILPLEKNLSYVGGLWYATANSKDNESDAKVANSEFGLNLATLRMTLD